MSFFAIILTELQAAIAARAARDRAMTVLLVAVWGRIARMRTRLERLIVSWRAGKQPLARAVRAGRVCASRTKPRDKFPTAPGWLLRRLGYEVAAFGSQLQHLLTEAECGEFLAAMPQAGRILRPLLRMLTLDPAPELVRNAAPPARAVPQVVALAGAAGVLVAPGLRFSGA